VYATEPYRNALSLQRIVLEAATKPECQIRDLPGLARAFCELEECKRKLKMRPLPKPIDVTPKLRQLNASTQQFIEASTDEANPKGISSTGEG
jgi:hypothetical protein